MATSRVSESLETCRADFSMREVKPSRQATVRGWYSVVRSIPHGVTQLD